MAIVSLQELEHGMCTQISDTAEGGSPLGLSCLGNCLKIL